MPASLSFGKMATTLETQFLCFGSNMHVVCVSCVCMCDMQAAQEREELHAAGDALDAKITQCEAEVSNALCGALKRLSGSLDGLPSLGSEVPKLMSLPPRLSHTVHHNH